MPTWRPVWFLTAFTTLAVMVGSVSPSWADENKGPPTPCDKELSVKDAVGILAGTATINHYSMSASKHEEGCEFGVTGAGGFAMVDFAVKDAGPQFFQNMLLLGSKNRKPLPGVGDEAYNFGSMDSNIPDATETDIIARKGALTCIVQLHRAKAAEKLVIPANDDEIAKKLGGLCDKVFAARAGK
jgi:hypothetical protein